MHRLICTTFVLLLAQPCLAQYPGRIPRWNVGFAPMWYPGTYYGFYSNGFSAYGPPVPTYAPIPGVFGGADQRFFAPGPSSAGLDPRFGRGYNDSMFMPPTGARPYPLMFQVQKKPIPPSAPVAIEPTPAAVNVVVRVPDPDAEVAFDGHITRQTGSSRSFQSEAVSPGQHYVYEVQAKWKENGEEVSRTRTVVVEAGQDVVVDFTQTATR